VLAASTRAAAIGYGTLGGASDNLIAIIQAFAAGAIVVMLADTTIPEAFEHGGTLVGPVTLAGVHDRIFGSRRSSSGGRVWVFAAVGKRGTAVDEEERAMANGQPESGTKDKNYDLITVTHLCLEHVFRLEQYAKDAEQDGDSEVAGLFRRMQEHSRRGGDECKRLLRERLKED